MEYSEDRTSLVGSASADDWAGSASALAGDAFVGTFFALERTACKFEQRSTAGAKDHEEKRWAQAVATERGAPWRAARVEECGDGSRLSEESLHR
mmetsp:Transcript_32108/g.63922  ORF Transcript_32108/g.63922 Transcript_32108/m.63922 type:complete len:95 (-) Transcript_32108:51-335(-)